MRQPFPEVAANSSFRRSSNSSTTSQLGQTIRHEKLFPVAARSSSDQNETSVATNDSPAAIISHNVAQDSHPPRSTPTPVAPSLSDYSVKHQVDKTLNSDAQSALRQACINHETPPSSPRSHDGLVQGTANILRNCERMTDVELDSQLEDEEDNQHLRQTTRVQGKRQRIALNGRQKIDAHNGNFNHYVTDADHAISVATSQTQSSPHRQGHNGLSYNFNNNNTKVQKQNCSRQPQSSVKDYQKFLQAGQHFEEQLEAYEKQKELIESQKAEIQRLTLSESKARGKVNEVDAEMEKLKEKIAKAKAMGMKYQNHVNDVILCQKQLLTHSANLQIGTQKLKDELRTSAASYEEAKKAATDILKNGAIKTKLQTEVNAVKEGFAKVEAELQGRLNESELSRALFSWP